MRSHRSSSPAASRRRRCPLASGWSLASGWILAGTAAVALAGCSPSDAPTDRPEPVPAADAPPSASDPLERALAAHWHAAGVSPTSRADDARFLRRIVLDLVGRIPTPAEVERFERDARPDKRAALVDELLARDEFADHWGDILTQTLLGGAVQARPALREGLHAWLSAQLHEDARWDRMTTALLTASGEVEPDGPAAFLLVHGRNNRVEALTGQTARVFLGLQLQCAQCHDDPDGRFTQAQFYGFAAYYARTRTRVSTVDGVRTPRIVDKARGEMRLPTAHDAPGDRSGARVMPGFPGLRAQPRAAPTRRQALARGIVDSPLFAKAAVNHAWAQMLGQGLVEPWDDLGGPSGASHPAVLEQLAREFSDGGHDLRALLRRIALSSAYQRSAHGPAEGADRRRRAFAQAAVRPMSHAQLLRSVLVATGLEDVQGRAFRAQVHTRLKRVRKDYALVFDDDDVATADAFTGNVPQALLLLNGELTNQGISARAGALAELLETHDDPGARIDALFVRLYGRPPSDARRRALVSFIAARGHGPDAYADVMHAMLLSSEFLTVH